MIKKKITLHKHVSNLGLKFDVAMKSLSVRDLKSISELEKLWYEKRDTSEKMTDDNIVDVYCKIRTVPNAGTRIHQIYFLKVLGIGLKWYEHPLLHPSTQKIHKDPQTSLWSRGNEIHHSGIWGWNQRTRREGGSTHRIPIRVWTGDVETRSWSRVSKTNIIQIID